MATPLAPHRARRSAHAALLSLGMATAALSAFPGGAWGHPPDTDPRTMATPDAAAPARSRWRDPSWQRDAVVQLKVLGINDFHGQLSPHRVGTRPAGGAAVLSAWLRQGMAANPDNTLLIHAGDHVGASPPNSALLQDEPAIALLNLLANRHCHPFGQQRRFPAWLQPHLQPRCNVVGTPGNHEFDEGRDELLRLLGGGNHAQGPFLESPWRGARFPYVSANVIEMTSGKPLLPPYTVRTVEGIRVGIIGAVLAQTPNIVSPSGVAGLAFLDEAEAINRAVRELRQQRVNAIIVTLHQGQRQTIYEGPTDTTVTGLTGPLAAIVNRLDAEVDVVIAGHAHGFTNALIPNAAGRPVLVTQAFAAGTAYADIDLLLNRRDGDVVEKSAAIVTTWGDEGPGLAPDSEAAALVAAADTRVAALVGRVVGVAQSDIRAAESPAGESALGNLIADAQRSAMQTQFACMNPGGIRTDLQAGEVTWGELFAIQPFGNDLVAMTLTGAQITQLLEQQWLDQNPPRILKCSGLTYSWRETGPIGARVVEVRAQDGAVIDPTTSYRMAVNSFIAAGGDNFSALAEGTERVTGPSDLEALVQYIESQTQPFSAAIEGRILRVD